MLYRLLILAALVGAIVMFVLQNAAPTLALAFLGIQTPALPLSWWVVGAMVAGGITTVIIQVLFGLSSFVTGQTVRSRVQSTPRSDFYRSEDSAAPGRRPPNSTTRNQEDSAWQDWSGYETTDRTDRRAAEPVDRSTANRSTANEADDWERPPSNDWEDTGVGGKTRLQQNDRKNFEVPQTPKRTSQSGSVYSHSYRESRDSEVGKPEPVVDAEYRVIVPPHRPFDEVTSPTENIDDWFEDPESGGDFDRPR